MSKNDLNLIKDLINKTKKLGTTISDYLLAYRMIKSTNLSEQDGKWDLIYQDVKSKLKCFYGDAGTSKNSSEVVTKQRCINHTRVIL